MHGTLSKHLFKTSCMSPHDPWQISGIEGTEENGRGWYKYYAVGTLIKIAKDQKFKLQCRNTQSTTQEL